MKILIIGEFSAFAKHLKNGFRQLGHKVWIVQTGDGFKSIKGDDEDMTYSCVNFNIFNFTIYKSYHLRAPFAMREVRKKVAELPHLDLIIVINTLFIAHNYFCPGILLSEVIKRQLDGTKVIMSGCGNDPAYHLAHRDGLFRYSEELFGCSKHDISLIKDKEYDWLLRNANVVIPISYDYWRSIDYYCEKKHISANLVYPIPLPISIEPAHINSCQGRKIVIFHGVIREQFKGTRHFIEALDRLKRIYPDKVECRVDGKMPYDKYVKLFTEMDILLDQTNSYGMGMNAELGLMKGKVVFTGNEPENRSVLGFYTIPAINAKPDADYIFTELEKLILHPEIIDEMKYDARRFAEKHLDAKIIAKRYLDAVNL